MEPGVIMITMDQVWYAIIGLGIANVIAMFIIETINSDIAHDVWKIMNHNKKLILEVGVLKAQLKEKEKEKKCT